MRDHSPDDVADLYHASYRRLVAQVYAFTTDLAEAQDAVSEAFARALARRGQLSDIDTPEAWLRTVAVNLVKRRWRRKQLLDRILLRERPVTRFLQEAPEPDRADLREALATLPRTYREVIVLHYLADLPVDEVAAILEVPVGTVKSRLSRGREALKGLLDDVEAPPLSEVERRAGTIKARRRVAGATIAVSAVLASAVIFFPFGVRGGIDPAASPSPSVSILAYSAEGLSFRSLPDIPTVPDLPGTIVDFDNDLLRTDANVMARSSDNGQTWEIIPYTPPGTSGDVWRAKRPNALGEWFSARVVDGTLAMGFARSEGGTDWQRRDLPGVDGDRLVAAISASNLIVLVLRDNKVVATYTGNGAGFTRTATGDGTWINGDPVALPDGRLLAAGVDGDWLLSADRGATWRPVQGYLPFVGSFRMISHGYVALDAFQSGWIATSVDGLSWQKLPIR